MKGSPYLKISKRIVKEVDLCPWCLGRQFTSDPLKFEELGLQLYNDMRKDLPKGCDLCNGFFEKRSLFGEVLRELTKYEFMTFDVSASVNPKKVELEDDLRARYKLASGSVLKKAILSYFRHHLTKFVEKDVKLKKPDVRIHLHIDDEIRFSVSSRPLFLEIRFIKYMREARIRAARCRHCAGSGCSICNWIGKERDSSLESFLLFELPKILEAKRVRITWPVRDFENGLIDGKGRPIYVAIKDAKKLFSAPFLIHDQPSGGVQLTLCRVISKNDIRERFIQLSKIRIEASSKLSEKEIRDLTESFRRKEIRISSMNEGKSRRRMVYSVKISEVGGPIYDVTILHETGINLMTLVEDDDEERRTRMVPSFRDFIHAKLKVCWIDVLDVYEEKDY
jgi:tRNA U54 and U55 pseudouridine synthase Pus10